MARSSSARQRHGIEDAADDARALQERGAVFLRDAQHVADHHDRQLMGEFLHDVHLPAVDHRVDQAVDQRLDARPHLLHPLGGEGLVDEAAQSGVVRRVAGQHHQFEAAIGDLVQSVRPVPLQHALAEILAEPAVAQDERDVGMPGGDHEAERRAVQGLAFPQHPVEGVGVADERRVHRVEDDRCRAVLGCGAHLVSVSLLVVRI